MRKIPVKTKKMNSCDLSKTTFLWKIPPENAGKKEILRNPGRNGFYAGKKEILRNPGRNGFLGPKNEFLKTGIGNLALELIRYFLLIESTTQGSTNNKSASANTTNFC